MKITRTDATRAESTPENEAARVASTHLRIPREAVLKSLREVPEINGFYVGESTRGGGQVLVGRDGGVLYGVSALTIEDMVGRWQDGVRTDPPEPGRG